MRGNIGMAYRGLGDYSKEFEYNTQSLPIAKEIGDRAAEGMEWYSIALEKSPS